MLPVWGGAVRLRHLRRLEVVGLVLLSTGPLQRRGEIDVARLLSARRIGVREVFVY